MKNHTAIIIDEDGIMLIFGGNENKKGVVYSLDLTNMMWSRIENVKYKRFGHSANLIEQSVYLFGGIDLDLVKKNDIVKYDIKS